MTSAAILAVMIVLFLVLAIMGFPVGMSVAFSAIIAIALQGRVPMVIAPQRMYNAVSSVTLMAIPFFMLVGNIMERSGITGRLVRFCNALVGWMRGGMCYASVLTGMLMGGVSGSAPADTAALSSILVPSLEELGYPRDFAGALMASSGSIGIIIPPSMPMIVLAGLTGISVGKLFMGGIIPGIFIGLTFIVLCAVLCRIRGYDAGTHPRFSFKEMLLSLKGAFLPLLAPIIIIGGIMSGIFTATESAVIAVVYILVLGMAVYHTIRLSDLPKLFAESVISSANIMLIIAGSSLFAWMLQSNNFGAVIQGAFGSALENSLVVMMIVNIIFFVGGFFLEGTAMQIMFIPILYPIATLVGINPVAFGVTVIVNIALGTLTPPVAVCLYVAASSSHVSVNKIIQQIVPFVLTLAVDVVIFILAPQLITFLPNLMA